MTEGWAWLLSCSAQVGLGAQPGTTNFGRETKTPTVDFVATNTSQTKIVCYMKRPPSVRAYAPTRPLKSHLRPPPDPRLKPGPGFVASGGVKTAHKKEGSQHTGMLPRLEDSALFFGCTHAIKPENRERFMEPHGPLRGPIAGDSSLTWPSFASTSRVRTAYL